jgi:hypothetical protein
VGTALLVHTVNEPEEKPVQHIRVDETTKARESRVGLVFMVLITLGIVALWVFKARKHDPRADSWRALPTSTASSSASGASSAGSGRSYVPELSLTASEALPPTRIDEVVAALAPRLEKSAACMGGIYGTAFVEVAFAPSGETTSARFASKNQLPVDQLLKDTCVLSELRAAKIAPGPVEIVASFPVRNMPSHDQMKKAADDILHDRPNVIVVPK